MGGCWAGCLSQLRPARGITIHDLLSATVVDVRGYEQGGQTKEGYRVVDAGDVVDIARYGRLLSSNREVVRGHCEDLQARRNVLKDTLLALGTEKRRRYYHDLAKENLQRWNTEAAGTESLGDAPNVQLHKGDWGAVTLELTRKYGQMFAVLNMANAYIAGGKYCEGSPAQEENMFRRTDCHFSVTIGDSGAFDQAKDAYHEDFSELLNAKDGRVYFDKKPRVCIRGGEKTDKNAGEADIGYEWLDKKDIFPFLELRAAAIDRRQANDQLKPFDDEMRANTRKRIEAQLHTLRDNDVKYVVLSAFGCGKFENPTTEIAALYRSVISQLCKDFQVIAFAIFAPGYGRDDNFDMFEREFKEV